VKARKKGLTLWLRNEDGHYTYYSTDPSLRPSPCCCYWQHTPTEAHRAGCPRLKPGQVAKVRVTIEEIK